jgi:hypothetical protein
MRSQNNLLAKFTVITAIIIFIIFAIFYKFFLFSARFAFEVLLNVKNEYYSEYGQLNECELLEKIKAEKVYFIELTNKVESKGGKIYVAGYIKDSKGCEGDGQNGVFVEGLDPIENRLFMLEHGFTIHGVSYITQTSEWTGIEFQNKIELKELLD